VTVLSPYYQRLLALLVLWLAPLPALAAPADPAKLEPEGYVSDFARVLDATSRAQLERYCESVEQATGAQLSIVTLPSLDGAPIEDFTNDLFRRWGVGQKGNNEGVMVLLAVRDRRSRVEVGYGLEPILPDGFAGSVLREMSPSLREEQYGQALLAGAAEIGERIAKAKGVSLTRTLPRRSSPRDSDGGFPGWIVMVALLLLFTLAGRRGGGGFLTWMLLGSILGRSRYRGGSWGGGGFGGYDSGGGFGGFGGGDSGGGGASGRW
jgi:uncharacterized protein